MEKCEICSKEFLDKRGFTAHMRIKHNDEKRSKDSEQKVKSENSGFWFAVLLGVVMFAFMGVKRVGQ